MIFVQTTTGPMELLLSWLSPAIWEKTHFDKGVHDDFSLIGGAFRSNLWVFTSCGDIFNGFEIAEIENFQFFF